jgi:prenyltransferase beta subunit
MLRAASRGTEHSQLDAETLASFLRNCRCEGGGFCDRAGAPDLYYTVFGVECMLALDALGPEQAEPDRDYLRSFGAAEQLDLVELGCLARCWADLGGADEATREALIERLEDFHCVDGGYSQTPGFDQAGVYGCFLAAGVQEDLTGRITGRDEIVKFLEASRTKEGAYSADPLGLAATVPTTAAAVVVLKSLGESPGQAPATWLKQQCLDGAFHAVKGAPVGDLLSTAVALHALRALETPIDDIRPACLRFLSTLRCPQGGYKGTLLDTLGDCEYTFYALLALGHLGEEG